MESPHGLLTISAGASWQCHFLCLRTSRDALLQRGYAICQAGGKPNKTKADNTEVLATTPSEPDRHTWLQSRWHARTKYDGRTQKHRPKVTIHIQTHYNLYQFQRTYSNIYTKCSRSRRRLFLETWDMSVADGGQGNAVAMFGCSRSHRPSCPPQRTRLETQSK